MENDPLLEDDLEELDDEEEGGSLLDPEGLRGSDEDEDWEDDDSD